MIGTSAVASGWSLLVLAAMAAVGLVVARGAARAARRRRVVLGGATGSPAGGVLGRWLPRARRVVVDATGAVGRRGAVPAVPPVVGAFTGRIAAAPLSLIDAAAPLSLIDAAAPLSLIDASPPLIGAPPTTLIAAPPLVRFVAPSTGARTVVTPLARIAATSPARLVTLVVVVFAAAGALAAGPVAAVVAGVYAGLAARGVLRHASGLATSAGRSRQLDELTALAAELRAGVVMRPGAGWTRSADGDPVRTRVTGLIHAAARLAEGTGAPLADLVERIEADARAADRGRRAAASQAAGARATAWLLAGLPLGGIALGFAIGVDPLHILLRTPIGAGCAVTAVALQVIGLTWADRLAEPARWLP